MADISRETRPALPVVRWLQVGAAAAGVGLALTVAPAIAVADDGSSSAASESSARSTAARASRHVAGTGPRSARTDVARPAASAVPRQRSVAPTQRAVTSIRPGVAAPAQPTASAQTSASAVAADPLGGIAAFFGLPGAPATSAPSLGSLPILARLTLQDIVSGTGPAVVSNPTAVVTGIFNQLLRTTPTADELQSYLNLLNLAGVNGVVAGLFSSTAFRQSEVDNYYLELLGRDATQVELAWNTSALMWGLPEPMLAAQIAGSPAFFQASAGGGPDGWQPTDTTFVRLLYRSMLGQTADPNALPGYVNELQNGLPSGIVSLQFATSDAFRQAKVQEIYAVLGQSVSQQEIAQGAQNWLLKGGLDGIATTLLAGSANVARIEAGLVQLPDMVAAEQIKSLLMAPYDESPQGFVRLFQQYLKTDPVTGSTCLVTCNIALLTMVQQGGASRGLPNNSILLTPIGGNVADLIPTQNEVDLRKSLGYPLTDPVTLNMYLTGGFVDSPGGYLMTANNGTTIIDGHHRWSGLYVINPYTQIGAIDYGYVQTAKGSLEEAQFGVVAAQHEINVATVEGENLFTIGEAVFKAAVIDIINNGVPSEHLDPHTAEIMAVFDAHKLTNIDAITESLWQNVVRMQTRNQPIPDATARGYMPQPDPYGPVLHYLENGTLTYSFPIVSYVG